MACGRQARTIIEQINIDLDLCRHMASIGHNEPIMITIYTQTHTLAQKIMKEKNKLGGTYSFTRTKQLTMIPLTWAELNHIYLLWNMPPVIFSPYRIKEDEIARKMAMLWANW